jgi:hypothetical protein
MAQATIRSFISGINNPEIMGGFWLPNIQRKFVWEEEQIERLFDSILRQYPIGTLLVWRTNSTIKRRKFIDIWRKRINMNLFFVPQDNHNKMLVLDGQQRLQSLFIALKGSYDTKELCLDILSGGAGASPDEIKYRFTFLKPDQIVFPFIKIKDIVLPDITAREIRMNILQLRLDLADSEKELIEQNVDLIRDVFCTQQNIHYQIVDSIDRPLTFQDDDIVEIFIRANSGGTPLAKKDLLFSLLVNSWEEADGRINDLMEDLNVGGTFDFDVDFILKTCLILINSGAKYDIAKFRNENNKMAIINDWDAISDSIRWCKDFVYGNTYIKSKKNLPSYLSLVPIIYTRFRFSNTVTNSMTDFKEFLLKANLTGVYGGVTDSFTDGIINIISNSQSFSLPDIFAFIRNQGKSIEITEDKLLDIKYGSKEIHLLFNIWYGFNYQPALKDNIPNVDHIFPKSILKGKCIPVPGTVDRRACSKEEINQLANLMLLTAAENQAGGKGKISPEEWFSHPDRDNDEYRNRHLIPADRELWKVKNFLDFVEARKLLIIQKFRDMRLLR